MDSRYEKQEIKMIFSQKYELWQKTEIAAIKARVTLGEIPVLVAEEIIERLKVAPINHQLIAEIEEKVRHDLNAFILERKIWLTQEQASLFHQGLTSYDTEEPAFALMLTQAVNKTLINLETLLEKIASEAKLYRNTIMLARTHGQEAKLQTHGKRLLTWYVQLKLGLDLLKQAKQKLVFSKMSGATGSYGDFSPQLEMGALALLGLKPFYGSTQIMPREIYLPTAAALKSIVGTICKIADDIRLGARSGNPIYQEPFKKTQMGSSAMPHKKNTISTEQMEGMFRLAKGYHAMIADNIKTWEERAIEQSCVERVAWPDLFHVTLHSIETIFKVISGMKVFTDNMSREIILSRGCYASDEAKNFLGAELTKFELSNDAYRIVQLAAENAHNPSFELQTIRATKPGSLEEAESMLKRTENERIKIVSIKDIIANGKLEFSSDLEVDEAQVKIWNKALKSLFQNTKTFKAWEQLFKPSYLLRHEKHLFQEILGI